MRSWLRETTGGLPTTFWYLWTGTLVNRLGSFVMIFMAIYLTSERHFTQTQAGLVIGCFGAGSAIGVMVGGVLADRWGRRPTLFTAHLGAAAMCWCWASPATAGRSRSARWCSASSWTRPALRSRR